MHRWIYNICYNSRTCCYPVRNHIQEATLEDNMGGSQANLWKLGQISSNTCEYFELKVKCNKNRVGEYI